VTSTLVASAPELMTHQVVGLAMATAGNDPPVLAAGELGVVKQASGPASAGTVPLVFTVEMSVHVVPASAVE